MMRLDTRTSLLLLSVFFLSLGSGVIPAESLLHQPDMSPIPYHAGETLVYKVKLRGIPAGKLEMRVLNETALDGEPVYHFESETKTKGFFKVYRFEDSQVSYVSKSDGSPVRYEKDLIDNSYHAQVTVDFQHEQGTADQQHNGQQQQIEIPTGVQDELSMVYLMRRKQLDLGTKYEFDLLTLKKLFHVSVEVLPWRERKKTVVGKRETIILRSTHGYQIWLTNDAQRIPIRIEADTRIGKITGELEDIR